MAYSLINGAAINGGEGESPDGSIRPAGMDLVTTGSATTAVVANATGSAVMEFGSLRVRNGVDVVVSPAGMDMVRLGLHIADVGMPPHIVAVNVAGSAIAGVR